MQEREQRETVVIDPVDPVDPVDPTEQQPEMMNFVTFSTVAVNLYCSLSDLVYKRVKRGQLPPTWSDESKELLDNAAANVLQGYNVPMSPIWQLVTTVVAVEVLRYATPKLIDQNTVGNA